MTETPVLISETYYTKTWAGAGAPATVMASTSKVKNQTFYIDTEGASGAKAKAYIYNGTSWVELANYAITV